MTRALSIWLLAAACALSACDANHVEPTRLELVYLPELRGITTDSVAAAQAAALHGGGSSVDLGEIRATRDYSFLLRNRGSATVQDVEVSLAGAADGFTVAPAVLAEVPPFGSTTVEEALASGLVRLTVEHGHSATGDSSYAPPLSPGPHRVTLVAEVSGAEGETERPAVRADLDVLARVTDISIFDAGGEVDLLDMDGNVLTGGFEAGTFVPLYNVSGAVRVVNTGNVAVVVERFYDYRVAEPFTLAPGEELEVVAGRDAFIAIPEADAVRDTRKLPILANGKTYLYLRP